MKSTKHSLLEAAYTFYYATDVAFRKNADASGELQKRLIQLLGDMLTVANNVSPALSPCHIHVAKTKCCRPNSMW